jgi:hypothetical protein
VRDLIETVSCWKATVLLDYCGCPNSECHGHGHSHHQSHHCRGRHQSCSCEVLQPMDRGRNRSGRSWTMDGSLLDLFCQRKFVYSQTHLLWFALLNLIYGIWSSQSRITRVAML